MLDGADQFFFGKQVTNPVKLLYGESFTGHNIIIREGLTASLELGTVMHEAIHHCVHNASDDDDDDNGGGGGGGGVTWLTPGMLAECTVD